MSHRPNSEIGETPLLLSVPAVCHLLCRSRARVYEMVRMHEIGHLRDGKSILIPRDALDEWIAKRRKISGC